MADKYAVPQQVTAAFDTFRKAGGWMVDEYLKRSPIGVFTGHVSKEQIELAIQFVDWLAMLAAAGLIPIAMPEIVAAKTALQLMLKAPVIGKKAKKEAEVSHHGKFYVIGASPGGAWELHKTFDSRNSARMWIDNALHYELPTHSFVIRTTVGAGTDEPAPKKGEPVARRPPPPVEPDAPSWWHAEKKQPKSIQESLGMHDPGEPPPRIGHDNPDYKWYVILTDHRNKRFIESGWEYKEDADSRQVEIYEQPEKDRLFSKVSVFTRRYLEGHPTIMPRPSDDKAWSDHLLRATRPQPASHHGKWDYNDSAKWMETYGGTVSHSTLRDEDLWEAFDRKLQEMLVDADLHPERFNIQTNKLDKISRDRNEILAQHEANDYDLPLDVEWAVEALNVFAHPGIYFGVYYGDGADFGYWWEDDV